MNAVEIADAVSRLVESPFNAKQFPFLFLEAFGNKETTIKRLQIGETNQSDLPGGVLQRNNIHIIVCEEGKVTEALTNLRKSPATSRHKAKFILATDGKHLEAENLIDGEIVSIPFLDLGNRFGLFFPLAGISTIKEIKDNAFDIKATGRLNKLYIELLKVNPEWDTEARREDLNHLMARLIFCFFAEDTGIFHPKGLFTTTVEQMSERDSSNTHDVLAELFRAMNTKHEKRQVEKIKSWALPFPFVNGGLFAGSMAVPKFSRIARSFLLHVGGLDWTKINPDIFGSMIQAVAEDEERGVLGMHYTSVPNILKVLNPLFLDELNENLSAAGESSRKLINLRQRIASLRVFDPACGSGNFLVIAYKCLRAIEAEINRRRGEHQRRSDIRLTNFRGIEIRHFSCEIARLALIITEFQCDVIHRSQQVALADFLPLEAENWITCGNALQLDWLAICPPLGLRDRDPLPGSDKTPIGQKILGSDEEPGEIYICGNPPYKGSKWQSADQKRDLAKAWIRFPNLSKTTDYVTGWIARYIDYFTKIPTAIASFVTTNSVCQGQQASDIWPILFKNNLEIRFAHLPFQWSNLANNNAGVTVIILGLGKCVPNQKSLYDGEHVRMCSTISPYLVPNRSEIVEKATQPTGQQSTMLFGNMPRDGGHLFISHDEAVDLKRHPIGSHFVKRFVGSEELINGKERYCLWIEDKDVKSASKIPFIANRLKLVASNREKSKAASTRDFSSRPHRFVQIAGVSRDHAIVVPGVSSENRNYLPVDYLPSNYIVGNKCFALYDAPLWNLAIIASRLHWVWIGTVCVRLEMRFSYSNTIGWNTFPLPTLTEKNKQDLNHAAEDILLTRETHFPATIADLYDPDFMPDDLREAHNRNDEIIERIYIGRRFKNDTERLEKLFDLYTKLRGQTAAQL